MAFSLGGLASGIDTGSLIDGLMSVARLPSDQLAKRKSQIDSASQTISAFSSKLSALKTAALALSTNVGFASAAATSSDGAIVATTTGSASVASYSVTVGQLARAQKTRAASQASNNTALGMAGSLDIKVGTSDAKNVAIETTDTLADIAAKISSSGARVSASVMNDGTGYRLIVQGLDSGAANSFTVGENNTALGFGAPGAPTPGSTYETAQDAQLTVDGMPVTSPTNQVSGVIGGLKLALTKTTTGPVTVQVTSDGTALKQKVTALMNAYNDFINNGHAVAGFGGTKPSNSVLAADSAVRGSLRAVASLVSNAVPGTSGTYTTLASIGLKTGKDGTLTLDGTKLDAALAADPESVRRLFVTDPATGATGLMKSLMTTVDTLVTGTSGKVQARINLLNAQSKRISDTKAKMDRRLEDYEEMLKKQFTAMDQSIGKYKSMSSALDSSILSNSNNNNNNG